MRERKLKITIFCSTFAPKNPLNTYKKLSQSQLEYLGNHPSRVQIAQQSASGKRQRERERMPSSSSSPTSTSASPTGYLYFLITWVVLSAFNYGVGISELNPIQSVISCKDQEIQTPSSIQSTSTSTLPRCIPMNETQFGAVTSVITHKPIQYPIYQSLWTELYYFLFFSHSDSVELSLL